MEEFGAPAEHGWCLDVKEAGGEEVKQGVFVSRDEEAEIEGSRGTANMVMRFAPGSKQCSLTVVDVKGKTNTTRPLTADDGGMVPIVAFECRGMEPVKWTPTSGYVCRSTGGKAFDDVDLTEGEWADYDEDNELPVSIGGVEHEFRVADKKDKVVAA